MFSCRRGYNLFMSDGDAPSQSEVEHLRRQLDAARQELEALKSRDWTESERTNRFLRESNERFQQMADHAPVMVWVSEPDGTTSFLSKSWYEFTGQSAPDALGFEWARAMHPDDLAHTRQEYESAVAERSAFQIEYRLRRNDGVYRWMLDTASPRFSDDSSFLGYIGSVLDITDRKETEDLHREEARLSDILNRVSQRLNRETELSRIIQIVTDEGTELSGAQFGAFFYNVVAPEEYMLYTLAGVSREAFEGFPMPRHTKLFSPTFRGERVIRSDDITRHADYGQSSPYFGMPEGHLPVRSYLAVPVVTAGGEVIGGLFFGHERTSAFNGRHEKLIESVAAQAAIAIENARLLEEVRETANRLKLAFEASKLGDWSWSYETDLITLSERAAEIIGVEGAITWPDLSARVAEEDRDLVYEAAVAAIENDSAYHIEYRIDRSDRSQVWVLVIGRPIHDSDHNLVGMSGIMQDITERKLTEAALAVSEDQIRTLANTFSHLAWMARPNGDIFWFNQMWYEFTGLTPDQSRGQGWSLVLDRDDMSRILAKFLRHLRSGEPWEDTFQIRRHDGDMIWHLNRMRPVRDASGEIILWFGTNTDISEQREADRRKDEFIAMLAHELRNPLSPLKNGIEVLKFGQGNPELFENMRAMMERQVDHMVQLVDDLMDVSRISRGVIQLRLQAVNLRDVIQSAVETSQPLFQHRRQYLEVQLPPSDAVVEADPTRLAQVVSNLLNNASKYSPEASSITLVCELKSDEVVIAVEDEGIGLAPSAIDRVFDMFAQVDSARDSGQGGLGIGLHLARRLTEMQGGTIRAESDGLGQGSRFCVTLPRRAAGFREADIETSDSKTTALKSILVVDDNQDAADSLAHLLENAGHQVVVAYGGSAALAAIESTQPQIVVMDIGMPEMDGNEVARQIRRKPWGADVRLIALTGWGSPEDRKRTREAGFDDHLVKPANLEALKRSFSA